MNSCQHSICVRTALHTVPSWYAQGSADEDMEAAFYKFGELTAEAQAARLLQCRHEGLTSIHDLAVTTGLTVERVELLMCRGLSTLIARGYPVEDLCATYHVTPDQLRRVATVPVFSNMFRPFA